MPSFFIGSIPQKKTLERFKDRVFQTADFMTLFATQEKSDDQYRHDHPIVTGALGMLPNSSMIDTTIMANTFEEVMHKWDWQSTWGWDYPMLTMTAARLDKPEEAVDALMMD